MTMSNKNLVHGNITREDLFYESKGEWKMRPTSEVGKILQERTALQYIRSYPKEDRTFIYDPEDGIYKEFTSSEMMVIISRVFKECSLSTPSMHALEDLTKHVKFHINAFTGNPHFDKDYLVFTNGMLNMSTGAFGNWDPHIFATMLLPYNFDPSAQAPEFHKFLKGFTSSYEDREGFLRAWFWAVLRSWVAGQIFLYLLGPGGTGKSTLVLILMALIGRANTITTTLRELSHSPFEAANLQGKKLIVISDNENYKGDLSVLKQMVGQDSIKGRHKFKMSSYDLFIEGMVVIVGNYPLASRDTMNAIGRRMRQFPADNICKEEEVEELLTYTPDGWIGKLSPEIPGIFAWAYQMESNKAQDYLRYTSKMVPSLAASIEDSKETMNPMLAWVREELEKGEGSYVGFKMENDVKGKLELSRRKSLYPTYRVWAQKRDILPLGHKRFTNELSFALQYVGFKSNKIRKIEGMYMEGIVVKSDVYNRDRLYGAPLISDNPIDRDIDTQDPRGYIPPERNKQHPALIPDLYTKYMDKLGKSPLKIELNKVCRKYRFDIGELVDVYFENTKHPSRDFIDRVTNVVTKGTKTINSFGGIPFSYKPMGTSPRILPVSYGNTINNTKRLVREKIYSHLGEYLRSQEKVIVDLDLVSCYTSILIGLYPGELEALQVAIESTGLWKYIYNEFDKNGKADVYDKAAVKICTYSSFFLGGNKAMINGILESFRKDMGLTQNEFKVCSDYEYFHTIARNITQEMQNSSVITDFREISRQIKETYMDEFLIGPTGHAYKVTEADFQSAYPNYLQSFEFALLAHTTLKGIEQFPEIEIIGHFHDGNVIIIPKSKKGPILEYFSETLKKLGTDLGLIYPQKLEVKRIYD